jgi:parvulin-like peptidyl-prolyl isomerase
MISAILVALAAAAAPAPATAPAAVPARVLLKPAAAAPACRATRVEGGLQVPLFAPESEDCAVAVVGEETIPLRDLAAALEWGHVTRPRGAGAGDARPGMDFGPALDRLVATRLLAQEAREMGLDDDPDFRAQVEQFRQARLRTAVQQVAAKGVKPDPAEVERLYREAVREWKVASVLLDKEEDAKALEAALRAGGKLEPLAKKIVAEKKGRGDGKAQYLSRKHMLPEILAAVKGAKQGAPVGPIKVPAGWVVLRVDGTRHPANDAAARADARARSLARMEREAVRRFYLALVAKHAKVDEKLLGQLDLEAKGEEGYKALMADERPLATIRGERPVTVADVAREIAMKFFHGIASPIEQHRVNPFKDEAFEKILGSRLFAREAAARKLDQRPEYRRAVEEYERALAFNTFVEKVVAPDVKVTEEDALRTYEEQKASYTAPEMFKLDGFAFANARDAQAALQKLKGGTDFAWLRSTAPGQVEPEKRGLQFDGRTVSAATLPPDLAKALAGAREGEYRLYAPRDVEVYVVKVVDHAPPQTQPYVEARETIAKKLYNDRLAAAIGDYAAKLRKAQRVEVLITRVSL